MGPEGHDLIGKVYWEEFPQAVGSKVYKAHLRAAETRRVARVETVSPILGHWVDVDIHPTSGGGLSVYFRDTTERKQTEAALRESEEFTRRILESSTDCIKMLDADTRLRFMSPGGLEVMEVDDFGAIEGCDWRDFWSGPEHAKAEEAVRTALAGGNARFQGQTPTMKGRLRWWDVAVTPMLGPDGSVDKLLSVSRDITPTKQWEEHQRLLINELNHTTEPPRLCLRWEEGGGPPVRMPKRRGFGARLIERSLAQDLDGEVRIAFELGGIICTADGPLTTDGAASAG